MTASRGICTRKFLGVVTREVWLNKVGVWYTPEPMTGCWLWMRGTTSNGYGAMAFEGRSRLAHRLSYELLVGPVPDGLQIDHLCRTRLCVNPDHLEPVTQRENILRGTAPVVENARRTHCVNGHPFDDANTGPARGGRNRRCRACNRDWMRSYYARKSA